MIDWTDSRLIQDVQFVVDLVSGKWTLPILAALERGPRRHNELRRAVQPGIHSKVFDETLHKMTARQLLGRRVEGDESPPAVWYELSPAAHELLGELSVLLGWVGENRSVLRSFQGPQDPRTPT